MIEADVTQGIGVTVIRYGVAVSVQIVTFVQNFQCCGVEQTEKAEP